MKMEYSSWLQKKVIEPSKLEDKVLELRSKGLTIATLNGSFDLLHAGHLYILYEAAKQGDSLIVALNTDRSIQSYKSLHRPIVPLLFRLEMMAAIECVDYVTWFDELDPCVLLSQIKPDVHVNGVEYKENCIEEDVVKKNGGHLHFVDRIASFSTSDLIKKIKGLPEVECV